MKAVLFALWLTTALSAEPAGMSFKWESAPLPAGAKLLPTGSLEIANTNDTPLRLELLRIENPAVSAQLYALRGRIRYERVMGDGFLEMWNVFPPVKEGAAEGRYFSRTLGVSGEMGKITGSSEWREFQLPFNRSGAPVAPKRLEINLILPGAGTVYLEPMTLVDYPAGFGGSSGAWWSDRAAGLIGGIGGAFLGCLGALIGFLAAKRKARGFVLTTAYMLIVLGGLLAMAGLAAVFFRQPYSVWFPLVLSALLLLTIIPARLRDMRRNYEDYELRRMAAFDTGRV